METTTTETGRQNPNGKQERLKHKPTPEQIAEYRKNKKPPTNEELEYENGRLRTKNNNRRNSLRQGNKALLLKDREVRYLRDKVTNLEIQLHLLKQTMAQEAAKYAKLLGDTGDR
jgi:hypothetical protein